MNEIDWSKAPEGATHYNHTCFDWYKVGSHEPSFWNGRAWAPARFWDDRKHDCIQRPTTPSWSGEGLPPVGVHVEWYSDVYGWLGGKVIGHDGTVAVVSHNDGYTGCHLHNLKPIRTAEQIAADEREKAIKEMTHVIYMKRCGLDCTPCSPADEVKVAASALYDAGYRKP